MTDQIKYDHTRRVLSPDHLYKHTLKVKIAKPNHDYSFPSSFANNKVSQLSKWWNVEGSAIALTFPTRWDESDAKLINANAMLFSGRVSPPHRNVHGWCSHNTC